jgi:hypothetical protein
MWVTTSSFIFGGAKMQNKSIRITESDVNNLIYNMKVWTPEIIEKSLVNTGIEVDDYTKDIIIQFSKVNAEYALTKLKNEIIKSGE